MKTSLIILMKLTEVGVVVFVPWVIGKVFEWYTHDKFNPFYLWAIGIWWIMTIAVCLVGIYVLCMVIPHWININSVWADQILSRYL